MEHRGGLIAQAVPCRYMSLESTLLIERGEGQSAQPRPYDNLLFRSGCKDVNNALYNSVTGGSQNLEHLQITLIFVIIYFLALLHSLTTVLLF